MRTLKQALNHELVSKTYIEQMNLTQEHGLNHKLILILNEEKNQKMILRNTFFKLMNNSVFGKTMEDVRKHKDIKLVTTNRKRSKLVSGPNYHTPKWFPKNFLATKMKKTKVKMNKPIYSGFSILDLSKIVMYEFWYDYIKQNMEKKEKQNYVTWTQIALLFVLKLTIFIKILQMMWKKDFTHQIMKQH